MHIRFTDIAPVKSECLVLFLSQNTPLTAYTEQLDQQTQGQLARAVELDGFKGKFGDTLSVIAPVGLLVNRVLFVGLGPAEHALDCLQAQTLGGKIMAALMSNGDTAVSVVIEPHHAAGLSSAEMAANIALGASLRRYRFDKYRRQSPTDRKPLVEKFQLMSEQASLAELAYSPLQALADGVGLARDLVTEPGNILYPESYAERLQALSGLGLDVEILDEENMQALGMEALLSVGQGSDRASRLVVMKWQGADSHDAPIAFVGKGVTFDSGGISIKSAKGLDAMKFDMGGSAAVAGLMKTLAGRKAKVNAIGVVGLVENMPSGKAYRPGDVINSMSGQTIEIINTDVEGRLVLADALWYTQQRYQPRCIIDLATLTYAVSAALGEEFAGILSNDDALAEGLSHAGQVTGEPVWRLPLTEGFDRLLDSDIADIKQCAGAKGDCSIAGQFLQRFVNEVPWVHIDIAGMAWRDQANDLCEKGATGYGVRLLNQFVVDSYEQA